MTKSEPENEDCYLVFISHAGEDTWIAGRIAEKIQEQGGRCFLDRADISIGEDFEKRILKVLQKADELLVLFTPWALDRQFIWLEIGAVWAREQPIVGILHGIASTEVAERARVPNMIKKRWLIKLNDLDRYFIELRKRISAKVGKD